VPGGRRARAPALLGGGRYRRGASRRRSRRRKQVGSTGDSGAHRHRCDRGRRRCRARRRRLCARPDAHRPEHEGRRSGRRSLPRLCRGAAGARSRPARRTARPGRLPDRHGPHALERRGYLLGERHRSRGAQRARPARRRHVRGALGRPSERRGRGRPHARRTGTAPAPRRVARVLPSEHAGL